jgi:hypothetical protein
MYPAIVKEYRKSKLARYQIASADPWNAPQNDNVLPAQKVRSLVWYIENRWH